MGHDQGLPSVCLYQILGAERNASADDIKNLYRKLALRWHPDKIQQSGASADECQEATARFQAISHAYDVLSDPQERAWYDSHRSAILASSSRASGSSTPYDYDIDLFPYFSASAYSGWGDCGDGFYAVYGRAFQQVHEQEVSFARAYGGKTEVQPPSFGTSCSQPAEFLPFYRFWQSFSTVKDFAWCDAYKVSDGPNRKSRRLMEEENMKIRKVERREFNDTVRELVSFVKKRDKRMLLWQLEQQRLQKEKEEMQKLKRQQLKEEKRAKALLYKEEEWCRLQQDQADNQGEEDECDEDQGSYAWDTTRRKNQEDKATSPPELEELFCVVCNKRFRSEKQWQNHEKSKKHIAKADALKGTFEDEDEQVDQLLAHADTAREISGGRDEAEGVQLENSFEDVRVNTDVGHEDSSEASAVEDEGDAVLEAMLKSHRTRSLSRTVEDSSSNEGESQPGTSDANSKRPVPGVQNDDTDFVMDASGTDEDVMLSAMLNSLANRKHASSAEVLCDDNETQTSGQHPIDGLRDGLQGLELSSGDAENSLKSSQSEKRQEVTMNVRGSKPRRRAKQGKSASLGGDRQSSVVTDPVQQKLNTPKKSGSSDITEPCKRRNRK